MVSFFVARNFGAEGYGEFTKITTYVAFFFLIADFGLNAVYLEQKSSFNTLLSLRILGGVVLMFLSIAILAFLPHGEGQGYTGFVRLGIILFSPAIFFQGLITSANAIFQKVLRYDLAAVSIGVGSVVTLVAFLIFRGVLGSTFAIFLGIVTTALVSLILEKRFVESYEIRFRFVEMTKLFVPAIPLGLTLLFNLVYFHGDSVILTLTRETGEVGIYGLAFKVFEVPLVLPTFFMNVVYPLMLKTKTDFSQFLKIVKKSFIFLLGASFIFVVSLWFAAPWIVLIKDDFALSVAALRVLSLGLPFFFLSAVSMWALIALGKQWALLGIYGAGMFLNIMLNLWFIPVYGYMAAAWVTVVSEGIVLLVSALVLRQTLSIYRHE